MIEINVLMTMNNNTYSHVFRSKIKQGICHFEKPARHITLLDFPLHALPSERATASTYMLPGMIACALIS